MPTEEKQLLLKDLCARLSYGVICHFIWAYSNETTGGEDVIAEKDDNIRCIDLHTKEIQADYYDEWVDLGHCKPYLRPLSSMTEEEYKNVNWKGCKHVAYYNKNGFCFVKIDSFTIPVLDYLISHHFDYRDMIPLELALIAPEGMYKTE